MTKLDELLQCIHKPRVYVQMHNYPDQDAIASAFGLQTLLQAKGRRATIIYHGLIDKDNTLKMVELLNIVIIPVERLMLERDDEIIIVDGQKGNINMHDTSGLEIACIDHHKMQNTECYRFSDIRGDVGACSSIIASYFLENDIQFTTDVATALLYGLKMDTAQLSRGVSDLDLKMFGHLFKLASSAKLRFFENNSIKRSDLMNYQKVISNLKVYDNIAIANIGNDCSEAIIGTVNDFLMTISEIEFTILYSFRAGGIKFSVRSSLPTLDASDLIRQCLQGLGDGGGHGDMAAGFIPNVSSEEDAALIARTVIDKAIRLVRLGSVLQY